MIFSILFCAVFVYASELAPLLGGCENCCCDFRGISFCAGIRWKLFLLGYGTACVVFRARARIARFWEIFGVGILSSGKYIFLILCTVPLGTTATWLLLLWDSPYSSSLVLCCWHCLPAGLLVWSAVLGIWRSVGQCQQVLSRIAQ